MGVFDAEGRNYDYVAAKSKGMKPNDEGHWGSVTEVTEEMKEKYGLPEYSYLVLKGRDHESWEEGVEAENKRGYKVMKIGDRYFSVPKSYRRFKAPWANSTLEEDVAYETALSLGGAEYEQEIADRMGPYGADAIDWRRAKSMALPVTTVGGKEARYPLHGFYIPDRYDKDETWRKVTDKKYSNMIKESPTTEGFESDMVYMVYPDEDTSYIQSHEFRHRYMMNPDFHARDKNSEYRNRLWDVYRARNEKEYDQAITMLHQYEMSGKSVSEDYTLEDTHKKYKNYFESGGDTFFAQDEQKAADDLNIKPPMKKGYWLNLPGEKYDIERGYSQPKNSYTYWREKYRERAKHHTLDEYFVRKAEEDQKVHALDAAIRKAEKEIEDLKKELVKKYGEEILKDE